MVLVVILLAIIGLVPVGAASVTPILINQTANLTCAQLAVHGFDGTLELKVDPPQSGTFSGSGGMSITVSGFDGKTFDWSSNLGVDAVFVKAGNAGSFLYVYQPPESFGDTNLTSPGATGNAISHIAFCYDNDPTTTTTTPPTTTPPTTTPPTTTPPTRRLRLRRLRLRRLRLRRLRLRRLRLRRLLRSSVSWAITCGTTTTETVSRTPARSV
jgi:hypothetical protein